MKQRYRVREAWTAVVGRDYLRNSAVETRRDSIGFALQAQDELRGRVRIKGQDLSKESERKDGRCVDVGVEIEGRIPGEPKRRARDGVVDLGCHASLGRGEDNG
jgi:hypothetical protein